MLAERMDFDTTAVPSTVKIPMTPATEMDSTSVNPREWRKERHTGFVCKNIFNFLNELKCSFYAAT